MNRNKYLTLNSGVLSVLILILMVSVVCGQAVAQTGNDGAKFAIGITNTPEMGNNDIYTKVRVEVPINILVAGEYRIIANLRSSGISWETTSPQAFYDTGSNQVAIDIPGDAIFDSGVQGPYMLSLSIVDKDGNPEDDTTHVLDYTLEEFNTTTLHGDIPDIVEKDGWIILRFEKLVAEISKTSPIVNYYYNDTKGEEEGKYTKAVLKIARIIAFDDGNNDGIPQDTEIKYRGNLLNHYWDCVIQGGDVYKIRQNANVVMKDMNFDPGPRLDVTFEYPAETESDNLAVTMEVQMTEPLGATHLCVESILSDGSEMGDREFVFSKTDYKGHFLSPDDDEQNYVTWNKKCNLKEDTGDKQKDCSFGYQEGADGHNTYATVGISTYTTSVTMNYNFGVIGDPWEPEPDYEHNLGIWFLGIVLAVVILAAAFFIQRKMARKSKDKGVV